MFTDRSKFHKQCLKGSTKEQSCEIISKSDERFQRRILKNFSEVHTVQKASPLPHRGHVFQRIKISQIIFEKGHTRNNLVKLFQILTSGYREEDFSRISSCPYSTKCLPPHDGHVFRQIKISRTIFEKGSTKEQSCEIISKSDERFQRRRILKNFSEVHTVKKPPPPWRPCFLTDQNFTSFEKGLTRNNPVKLFQNRTSGFREDF